MHCSEEYVVPSFLKYTTLIFWFPLLNFWRGHQGVDRGTVSNRGKCSDCL